MGSFLTGLAAPYVTGSMIRIGGGPVRGMI